MYVFRAFCTALRSRARRCNSESGSSHNKESRCCKTPDSSPEDLTFEGFVDARRQLPCDAFVFYAERRFLCHHRRA